MADEKKEPMIGRTERPGQVDLDASVGEMKLRDLINVLGNQSLTPEHIKPEWSKPEHWKPEGLKPEHWKPEHWKPEGLKPEWFKPESFKPERIKPEQIKPELTKPPFELDPFLQVIDVLSEEQLDQVAKRIEQRRSGGNR